MTVRFYEMGVITCEYLRMTWLDDDVEALQDHSSSLNIALLRLKCWYPRQVYTGFPLPTA